MKHRIALYTLVLALVLTLTACGNSTPTLPTIQPLNTNTPVIPPETLAISSTNAFVDSFGTYHVVGEVTNNTSKVLTLIELTIEIKDAAGISLLKDDNGKITPNAIFSPMLYTLAPGESSPFEYSYETAQGTPASYNVTITGQQTGNTNRAKVNTENVQLVDNGSGWYYLTGEVVNTGSQWAHINSLAGAVMDDSGKVLSADWTATFATELAPAGDPTGRDRSPFEINFPNPGSATKWEVFSDADVTDSVTDYALGVTVTNSYFDQFGTFHVVGWVNNNSDKTLDSLVVAGIFATDKTVLDSSYAFVPIPIKPTTVTPFTISSFSYLNYKTNQTALVSSESAMADPWFTSPTKFDIVDLTATSETGQKDGSTWTFDGSVINTSEKNLSSATVVVMIMDAQKKLIAMEYTSISPSGDAIAAGDANTYSINVYLDPAVDTTGYTTKTIVIGNVK